MYIRTHVHTHVRTHVHTYHGPLERQALTLQADCVCNLNANLWKNSYRVVRERSIHRCNIVTGIQNCNKSKFCEIDFFPFVLSVYSNKTFRRIPVATQ